mmetsp:Transcript_3793/g.5565  ORF Transcript_3793/g.5565 Transcript_3793/m.5565 type:complete len:92 (+) Transcript_3793:286-561(+)
MFSRDEESFVDHPESPSSFLRLRSSSPGVTSVARRRQMHRITSTQMHRITSTHRLVYLPENTGCGEEFTGPGRTYDRNQYVKGWRRDTLTA